MTARRDEPAADPSRREFFRTFGRQTVRNAGAVMGAAAQLRRAGGQAARDLLDLAEPGVDGVDLPRSGTVESLATFRSAYRLSGDALLILDQRELPGRVSILTCREPSEVASAIRLGAVNAGPVTGELAAYAIALAAADVSERDQAARDQSVHAAANTLRGTRPDVHALTVAVDRLQARYVEVTADDSVDGRATAVALREEADAIATEAQLAHAALGRVGAQAIGDAASGEPINLLMHADMGPLSCGLVGTATAIIQFLMDGGRSVHVWVTEAAPSMEGIRLGALQLAQLDVPHTVIPDTAVSWLLSTRNLDGALLRGDTVGEQGFTLGPIGSLNVANLAAQSGVPVFVVAPPSSFAGPEVPVESLAFDPRSPSEAGGRQAEGVTPPTMEVRLDPTTDIVPPRRVTAFISATGLRPARSA